MPFNSSISCTSEGTISREYFNIMKSYYSRKYLTGKALNLMVVTFIVIMKYHSISGIDLTVIFPNNSNKMKSENH